MNIRSWMKFWSLSWVLISLVACKTTKTIATEEVAVVSDNILELEDALLWEITGNNLETSSFLYGTIHLIDKESFYWPAGTLSAFDASEYVSFEVDLDDMYDMSKQMSLMMKAFMADGKTLKDLYSEEDYKLVKGHFDDMGIPMMLLEKMKPMFLTVFASGDVEFGQGFGEGSSMKSYEMELYSLAQDAKKDVSGLETLDYQMAVFDSIPYQAQADMLLETIKGQGGEDDTFKEMIKMYLAQDINQMVSSMSEEDSGIEGYEDVLLYTRNKNWIPIMSEKMKMGKTFFAVGAGHLGGEDGVIDLLQEAGYMLTPISHQKGI